MDNKRLFTDTEQQQADELRSRLRELLGADLTDADMALVDHYWQEAIDGDTVVRDVFGLNPLLCALQTAVISAEETGLRRDGVMAVLLYAVGTLPEEKELAGVAPILRGLVRIQELYKKNPVIESENFRNLILSFAEDMRVILIMIADRVNLMRQIRDTKEEGARHQVSLEANYLYAPLAHKLGLYKLKSELEDLSLKYLEHDAYYMIKDKLNATKQSRDAYIERFIGPIEQRLKEAGLHFHMKGRTKSIHSIWQKMKKQKCGFEGIYDLFAIRIIIDNPTSGATEHALCWQAYSIITDMYQPNPKRLRDWLSVPKSNGYESLHITVLGPEQKWVEVQIRTERMDDIAERGLAAHWRYKGIHGAEGGLEEWLSNIRTALEAGEGDNLQVMDQFRMDLCEDEVYVFTPHGDLFKLRKGATVLDFAYNIHTNIGNHCTGARINGKNVSIREELHSGDQVEIITQNNQRPKQDWLSFVKTSRAKSKIRLALKETQTSDLQMAKEMLERRFKNKKVEFDESTLFQVVKRMGFKEMSDFYRQVADAKLDANEIIERYIEQRDFDQKKNAPQPAQSAEAFSMESMNAQLPAATGHDDVLVIDRNLKGLDYSLAKCCRPIYGDDIFGFVTISGGIKIHRTDCPNAPELQRRFGYRVVRARWSGKGASQYSITLRVIGNDDIGIVNNITNIISKEEHLIMRSINIDSSDGLFRGTIVVMLDDNTRLQSLIRKIQNVRGVKQVDRI